jgi:hypothetical protein
MLGSNGRPVSSGLILSASSGGISRRHNGKLDTNSWSPIKISKAIAMFLLATGQKTASLSGTGCVTSVKPKMGEEPPANYHPSASSDLRPSASFGF